VHRVADPVEIGHRIFEYNCRLAQVGHVGYRGTPRLLGGSEVHGVNGGVEIQ
jgi:hypothetical protein